MSTGVKIRRAYFSDALNIHSVEVEAFSNPWSLKAFENELNDNELAYYLIAEKDGSVIGYAGMWLIVEEAHVTNVAISTPCRGQGIGQLLMKTLIEHAASRGAQSMTLEVRVTNAVAQGLYEKMGFIKRGVRRQYYSDNREDALIMWLDRL